MEQGKMRIACKRTSERWARCAVAAALLLAWPLAGQADTFTWSGDCGALDGWYNTCSLGECSPGVPRVYNNWGLWTCAPASPPFPGAGDTVIIGGAASLPSDATVSTLTIDPGGVLTKTWYSQLVVQGGLTNAGQLILYNTGKLVPWGNVANSGTIALAGGTGYGSGILEIPALITVSGSGSITLDQSAVILGDGTLTNAAGHTIRGGGEYSPEIQALLVNNGLVNADSTGGPLWLSTNAKTNNATMAATNGASLKITAAVTQQGAGQVVASGANSLVSLFGGVQVTGGTLSGIGGGTVRVLTSDSATITDVTGSGSWRVEQGATLNVTGTTWTNNASVDMPWSTLNFVSPVTVAGTGEIILAGPYSGSTIQGAGLVNGAGHTIHGHGELALPVTNHGTVRADVPGGTLTLSPQTPGFTNQGTLEVSSGCDLSVNSVTLFNQTGGELVVDGNLWVNGGALDLEGGKLEGAGTVNGSVSNGGASVNPGSPVGRLTVNGDYTQGSGGMLLVELGGTAAGQYDVLDVNGTASLGGTLYVTSASSFHPQAGETFTILEANTVSGQFAKVQSWVDSDCSMGFTVTYESSSVMITAQDMTAGVFCDNFESGDTSGWSHTLP